jgi:hypothetical protein
MRAATPYAPRSSTRMFITTPSSAPRARPADARLRLSAVRLPRPTPGQGRQFGERGHGGDCRDQGGGRTRGCGGNRGRSRRRVGGRAGCGRAGRGRLGRGRQRRWRGRNVRRRGRRVKRRGCRRGGNVTWRGRGRRGHRGLRVTLRRCRPSGDQPRRLRRRRVLRALVSGRRLRLGASDGRWRRRDDRPDVVSGRFRTGELTRFGVAVVADIRCAKHARERDSQGE